MHGVSGSGKSWHSEPLTAQPGWIRLRSDRERLRLFPSRHGRYSPEANTATYQHLRQLSHELLSHHFSVVVDAAFLRHEQRAAFIALARELDISVAICSCQADPEQLKARIALRNRSSEDPSEATLAVLDQQLKTQQPLDPAEQQLVVPQATEPAG